MRFRTTIQLEGKTATGFRVPPEVVVALGSGMRPPVVVRIGEYSYRSTVAAFADVFMLPLAGEHRTAAGVAAGDEIDVDVELDTAPRVVEVPADFALALDAEPAARMTFDALSNSNKKFHVLAITAQDPESREIGDTRQHVAASRA